MRRRSFLAVVGGAAAMPLMARADTRAGALDGVLRGAVERKEVTGVSALVVDRHRVLYERTFGTAGFDGRPVAPDTLFYIASMTKPVTSLAAMQLIEQGRLALEDPVEKYLPSFVGVQVFDSFDPATGAYKLRPPKRPVTVRHLFTHTSGLGYAFTSAVVRDFKPRPGESYPVGPLLFDPGERWHYGTSLDELGRVVEKISGQPLEAYFREHIFEPLRMSDTFYFVPPEKQARVADVGHRQADGSISKDANQPPMNGFMPIGGGGLRSTARDYARFMRMVLNGGALDGARVLSAKNVALMRRNHIGKVGVRALKTAQPERSADFTFIADGRDKWGLGFLITAGAVPGKRSAGSLSWGGIDNTYFWIDPSRGIAGVILMQFLPFADPKALAVYDGFERGVYKLV
ncbi:MAG TPA: serine hydrolase domain-containing protein [Alphaproteobacteria bacterium]|nr:serine hydrolase domain-containing protein [Alphaproteobacteria bacterium]